MKQSNKKTIYGLVGTYNMQPKNNRKYSEIVEGDMVRIMIRQTSLIKHTCQAGQVKHIKLLELIIITLC